MDNVAHTGLIEAEARSVEDWLDSLDDIADEHIESDLSDLKDVIDQYLRCVDRDDPDLDKKRFELEKLLASVVCDMGMFQYTIELYERHYPEAVAAARQRLDG